MTSMEPPLRSEVAQFRQQQALQDEAALLALTGFAYTASHAYINARMEHIALRLQQRWRQIGTSHAIQEACIALDALSEEMRGDDHEH